MRRWLDPFMVHVSNSWNRRSTIDCIIRDSPEFAPTRTPGTLFENEKWLGRTEGKSKSMAAVKKQEMIAPCWSVGASHHSTFSDTNSSFNWLFRVCLCGARPAEAKIPAMPPFASNADSNLNCFVLLAKQPLVLARGSAKSVGPA
jgi:hypothetical protein